MRTCARPPFALEHRHQSDALHLVYRNPKPVRATAPGARPAALLPMPLKLITKIAALVPPPRAHRHRTYGVLAPNASLRSVATALAPAAVPPAPASAATSEEPRHRAAARYLWAMLLARIYEALPLSCPICHSQMRIIAFINDAGTVGKILNHIGESTQPRASRPRVGHRCGRLRQQRNRRATIASGICQPIPHRRPSSISASPGRWEDARA